MPLIVFEGIDGCGKTTQATKLIEKLEHLKYPCHLYREPGGTEVGEKIRTILLDSTIELSPLSQLFLFLASRTELVQQKIKPLLKKNVYVILDRFFYSTIIYQGYIDKILDIDSIMKLNSVVIDNLMVDMVIYIHIDIKTAWNRLNTKDRYEERGIAYFNEVQKGYDEMAKKNKNFVRLDGNSDKEKINTQLFRIIKNKFL